jgi:two-component system sensor histidine kinase UhpB
MSLRLRLNILLAVLNLGFLAALTGLLASNLKASIRDEIEAAHRVTVQLLGTAAQTSPLFGPAPLVMQDFLNRLGRVRANEIRFYTEAGPPGYVSPPSTYKAGRRAPEWFAELMAPRIDAVVITLPGARLEVIPDASRAILDAWDNLIPVFLLGAAFVALLHAVLLWFLRRLLRPAESVLDGLHRLAQGRFEARLPVSDVAEWHELTVGFNSVASVLQQREAEQRALMVATRALAENREVTRLIQDGIEGERKRLSRELHDELGQSVTAIRLIATSLCRNPGAAPEIAAGAERIAGIAAGLYDGVHRIVRELRPAVLDQADLSAALDDLAREWRARHAGIELHLALMGDCGDLGEAVTLAVFRFVQEALTNVLKHAEANRVEVEVRRDGAQLTASVSDNGRSGEEAGNGSRRGLAGMRERAAALGGTLEAGRREEGGFRVAISLPLGRDTS